MRYLIIIDPLDSLIPGHDTSIAFMQAIEQLKAEVWVCQARHLNINNGVAYAIANQITTDLNKQPWYHIIQSQTLALSTFNIILMRKDPPFDMNYIFATYILDLAAKDGTLVVNNPKALRDFNEKLILNYFPQLTTDYLVACDLKTIVSYVTTQKDVVLKPLDAMGGEGIKRLQASDKDLAKQILLSTNDQTTMVMLMPYIPEVVIGDKRILLMNGKAVPFALLRTPPEGQLQANIAAGGTGSVVPLTDNDYHICQTIAPFCLEHGLYFVGIDVIGNYVTEINITSPTCLCEIADYMQQDLALQFISDLQTYL